jgi:hypothetical protein
MTDENGKLKSEVAPAATRPPRKESEISRPGLEKYFPPGPWTEDHERWFQIMIKEFGGAPERHPDL